MTLEIKNVSKLYAAKHSNRTVRAVSDVSISVDAGKTMGIIGESGCGKSTLARLIAGLEEPTSGAVEFEGHDVSTFSQHGMRDFRRRVQMVFQDPYSSLNPRLTAGDAIEEVVRFHGTKGTSALPAGRTTELLELVGLDARFAASFPSQLSGGQRQRVCIARALAADPSLLILDEPVSALDVSVRAGIMNLLEDLKQSLGLTYVFISHDLGMVRHISDELTVMYLGRVVESGAVADVMEGALHPYTRALLKAAPDPADYTVKATIEPVLTGEVPSPTNPPTGCSFHPRCAYALDSCATAVPEIREMPGGHKVRCVIENLETTVPMRV